MREEAVTAGEDANLRTWVDKDGTLARQCLRWVAYHGDLGGSSGGFCIVEWNAIVVTRGWYIDSGRVTVEDIRE